MALYSGSALLFLDADSCLSGIEGIDELARLRNTTDQIVSLTSLAMNGVVPFEDVFEKRLEIVRPSRNDILQLSDTYIQHVTPYAQEVCRLLQAHGVVIYIISGGYIDALIPLARFLSLPESNVLANTLSFDARGRYIGFDRSIPLCKRGGKTIIIESLKKKLSTSGRSIMVGDSVEDLDVKKVVDVFVGFGGYVVRESVVEQADYYIPVPSMASMVPLVLGLPFTYEIKQSDRIYSALIEKGIEEFIRIQ